MLAPEKLAEVTEIIKYTLYSDYLKLDITRKEVPISAALVAPPESAKSSVVQQFVSNNNFLVLTDATAWGIQNEYLEELKVGGIRIMIPDLINPINRKQETVNSLVTFLNSYISWEGVRSIATYAFRVRLEEPLRGSLLTTIATKDFKRMVKSLAAVGFLSRLLLIGYFYNLETARDILRDVACGRDQWGDISLNFPDRHQEVSLPSDLALLLIPQAEAVGRGVEAYGIRMLKQLMILARSKALSEGRDIVNKDDIDRIIHLANRLLGRIPDIDDKTDHIILTAREEVK